jgi:Lysylphosphatidylglycerol synthase TM region
VISRAVRVVTILAGAAVIFWLVWRAGPQVVLSMLRDVGWAIVPVAALYALHVALRAVALWWTLPDGLLPLSDVLRVRVAGELVEIFTGPWLAEPTKGWLLVRRGLGVADAVGYIALEYLLYTIVAGWMAGAAFGVLWMRHALPRAMAGPVLGIEVIVFGVTIAWLHGVVTGRGVVAGALRLGGARGAALAARVAPAEDVLVTFLSTRKARLVEVLGIQLIGHLLLAAEIAIVFRELHLTSSWSEPLIFEGAAKFIATAFFFVPGQVGAQEGVYTLIAGALGVPAAAGLTLALARRLRNILVGAAGLLLVSLTSSRSGALGGATGPASE